MRRTLLAAGVLFSACLANSAGRAGDKTFQVVISPAAHKPAAVAGSTAKRKRIEQQLQAPLDLPLEGRETITLAELIEHVRTRHRIAIRFDAATLRTLLTDDSFDIPNAGCQPTVCTPATCAPAAFGPAACPPMYCSPIPPSAASCPTPATSYYFPQDVQYFPASRQSRRSNVSDPHSAANSAASVAIARGDCLLGTDCEPKPVESPQEIGRKVATALRNADVKGESGLGFYFKNGTAYLSGTVASEEIKERAIQITKSIDGVRKVDSQLQVKASTATESRVESSLVEVPMPLASTVPNNAQMALSVADAFRSAKDGKIEGRNIEIGYFKGQVILRGEMKSESDRAAAIATAKSVAGVHTVIDVTTTEDSDVLPAAFVDSNDRPNASALAGGPFAEPASLTVTSRDHDAAVAEVPLKGAWHTDFEKAQAEARSRKVPLVVQFGAPWCGPCQQMSKMLESSETLKALATDCVGVRVDVDQSKDIAAQFNISAIPATVVLQPSELESRIRGARIGLIDQSQFLALLKSEGVRATVSTSPSEGCCATKSCPADCPVASCCPKSSEEECEGKASIAYAGTTGVDMLRHTAVSVESLSLEDTSIESALNQLLEALTPAGSADELGVEIGLPVRMTCANDLAYLVVDDGILVTSRMNANLRKETRIYRLPMIPNCPAERVAQILTHTVRPWSWRSQVNEMAEKLASKCATPNVLGSLVQGYYNTAIQMAGGVTPQPVANGAMACPTGTASTDPLSQAAAGVGQLAIHGAATLFQGGLSALEMVHHGDPPTAVIETLPGMLIITQSQAAHREIADFLEQLQEASAPQYSTTPNPTYGPASAFRSFDFAPSTEPYPPPPKPVTGHRKLTNGAIQFSPGSSAVTLPPSLFSPVADPASVNPLPPMITK